MTGGVLRVIQPGLHTTVQDIGRIGSQRLGIPVSGALDPLALRAANVVVGNPQSTAGLEIAVMGPALELETESARVAVAGQGARLVHEPANGSSPKEIAQLQSVRLTKGDRVRVSAATDSSVAYLAIQGGLALAPFMGSLSTYVRGGFGGFNGRALSVGDCLPLHDETAEASAEVSLSQFDLSPPAIVRVVLGPQDDYFSQETIAIFLSSSYTISREADRMGLRLDGQPLEHSKGYNIVSDGIAPGSIQVPGSCLPIILLADRQTTGGYPKIATVISADLAGVGRLRPGARIGFDRVSLAEALSARRQLEQEMASLASRLKEVRPDGPDLDRLYDSNLISGVLDPRS